MFLQHGSPRRVRAFAPSTTRLERRRVVSLHAFGEAWRGEGGEIDWEFSPELDPRKLEVLQ